MMSTIVSVSTCEGDDDDDGDDCDEHHRVRFNLDDLCGDICKSPESFCLLSNLLRSMWFNWPRYLDVRYLGEVNRNLGKKQ